MEILQEYINQQKPVFLNEFLKDQYKLFTDQLGKTQPTEEMISSQKYYEGIYLEAAKAGRTKNNTTYLEEILHKAFMDSIGTIEKIEFDNGSTIEYSKNTNARENIHGTFRGLFFNE